MPADRHRWMPRIAVVALAVMVALVLIARPTHDVPVPANVALSPLPPAAAEPAASAEPAPSPSLLARYPRTMLLTRAPSTTLRDASARGRGLPRATVVYRVGPPRDSTQSP